MCKNSIFVLKILFNIDFWIQNQFLNSISSSTIDFDLFYFSDFTITLAYDVVRSREESAFSDFSDQVSRRMGFPPIPIAIMLVRVIIQSVDFTSNFYSVVFGRFLYKHSSS